MREERGRIIGDVVVYEPFELWGSISGSVSVIEKGKFYARGAIYGNLTVEYGGRVHVFGNVSGDVVVHRGAKVIVSGAIGGDVINRGGRLYIDASAKVLGKVKTRKGETTIERGAQVRE
jgi:cytoskeletal protein CcmA (bactofilin family)